MDNDLLWLHGLEEYFKATGSTEYETLLHKIKIAVTQGDPHSRRDLILRELYRDDKGMSEDFINIILNKGLNDNKINSRKLLQYISHTIDDPFIKRISAWSIEWGEKANLNDHFSRGQMRSKFWLISKLDKIKAQPTQVALLGGWYATLAYFLFTQYENITKIRSLDLDPHATVIADRFNYPELHDNWKFKATVQDAGKVVWQPSGHFKTSIVPGPDMPAVRDPIYADLIINTSCEHMNDEWFYNTPQSKLIALQTNDYFDNPQHSNCVRDVKEALEKYRFDRVLYSGTLKTELYNRFMIIGYR